MTHHHVSEEQIRYSVFLNWGMRIGLFLLITLFALYVFEIIPTHIPLNKIPEYWDLPVGEYLKQTGSPTGWGWAGMLNYGDFASLSSIAWLSGSSVICLVAVIPIYSGRRDMIYAAICILEIGVQLLAASGLLHSGH